jgi:hypothetical protein
MMLGINRLSVDYDPATLATYALFFFLTKGLAGGILRVAALPYYQLYHGVSLADYHELFALVILLPWSLKPLAGVASDMLPIGGYRKRYYVLGALAALVAAALALAAADLTVPQSVLAFGVGSGAIVVTDLLFEASYAQQYRDRAAVSGAALITWCWAGAAAGGCLAAILVGAISDSGRLAVVFVLAVPGPVLCAAAVARGGIPERRANAGAPMGGLAVAAGFVVVAAAIVAVGLRGGSSDRLPALAGAVIVVCIGTIGFLPRTMAWANLYLFFAEALYANFAGATDYFFTSDCSGGTQFTYTFYITYGMLLSSVFALAGVVGFRRMEAWPLKSVFASLAGMRVALAMAEVCQAARWNVGYVSDEVFFLLAEGVVQPAISVMFFLPMVVLTSRLCVDKTEAITYATLAGTQNLGTLVAALIGQMLTERHAIQGCDFSGLPHALVTGHMALPLATIPLAYLLLPDTPVHSKAA